MKNFKQILLCLIAIGLFSCTESGDLQFVDEDTFYESVLVTTYNPVVEQGAVAFRGEITKMNKPIKVTYGFMWYNGDDADPEIQEVELGSTTGMLSFSTDMTNLPRRRNLVVCTFLRHQSMDEGEYEYIGDEIPFSNL